MRREARITAERMGVVMERGFQFGDPGDAEMN